jgi:hypothetical protein
MAQTKKNDNVAMILAALGGRWKRNKYISDLKKVSSGFMVAMRCCTVFG